MRRRAFCRTAVLVGAVAAAGCQSGPGGEPDAVASVERDVLDLRGEPFATPPTVEPLDSESFALRNVQYQQAGEQGVVVAGEVEHVGDRTFEEAYLEVTLRDENETRDGLLDERTDQVERENFAPGEVWSWAVTFRDDPLPEVDSYAVEVGGWYD